jgi:hypothetical protein
MPSLRYPWPAADRLASVRRRLSRSIYHHRRPAVFMTPNSNSFSIIGTHITTRNCTDKSKRAVFQSIPIFSIQQYINTMLIFNLVFLLGLFAPLVLLATPSQAFMVSMSPSRMIKTKMTPSRATTAVLSPRCSQQPLFLSSQVSLSSSDDAEEQQQAGTRTLLRNKLRQVTGFSLTAFRATARAATGISFSAIYASTLAATGLWIRYIMSKILSIFPAWVSSCFLNLSWIVLMFVV